MFLKSGLQSSTLENIQNKKYFSLIQNEVDIMRDIQKNINSEYFVKIQDAHIDINCAK